MQQIIAIGLMTGSSMDGIDGAMIVTDGSTYAQHLGGVSIKYTPEVHIALRAAEYAVHKEHGNVYLAEKNFSAHLQQYESSDRVRERIKHGLDIVEKREVKFADIVKKLTLLHCEVVEQLLIQNKYAAKKVDVIGFHGQTLYHNAQQKITVQIGDPQLLALKTGIFVVNDFRANDLRHGGQGAPFAPLYHYILACMKGVFPIAVLNCGGIANISIIAEDKLEGVFGFDVGPGNVLIDQYMRKYTQNKEFFDLDGKYGRQGQVNPRLLKILQEEGFKDKSFLHKLPPKALDAGDMQLPNSVYNFPFVDVCCTLEAFTAQCIVDSIDLLQCRTPKTWVLAGGGWKNPIITEALQQLLCEKVGSAVQVHYADDFGWRDQYLEAEMFAYLAVRSLKRLPLSLPNTTGVTVPTTGGHGYMSLETTQLVTNLLQANRELLTGYR